MSNQEKMLKRCNEIHQNKYNYSLVEYKNSKTKRLWFCAKHEFFLIPEHKHHEDAD